MGDSELDKMVDTYSKTEQSKKHIFIFDRDNNNMQKRDTIIIIIMYILFVYLK